MSIFFPKQVIFFDLLKDLSSDLKDIAALFEEFAEHFQNFTSYSKKAKECEKKADLSTHKIIDKLNKTFITPFDREDIYLLAHNIDDIVDLIENVIHNIELYGLKQKVDAIEEFAPLILEAAHALDMLLDCLRKRDYSDAFVNIKIKIHELEDKGDEIFGRAISKLFQEESDPIFVIKLKDILESLENVMDKYQTVSDIIEGIVVKSR